MKTQKEYAEDLISEMYQFLPSGNLLVAKFCAIKTCKYLIQNLPNVNNTPPINRLEDSKYSFFWMGVISEIEKTKL